MNGYSRSQTSSGDGFDQAIAFFSRLVMEAPTVVKIDAQTVATYLAKLSDYPDSTPGNVQKALTDLYGYAQSNC